MNSGKVVSDQFPAGLHVLVVDDDLTTLLTLQKMLATFHCKVTTCNRAETALELLRQIRNGFDMVISEVHMPDMDGFKLLELIKGELDIPVIMMSADDGMKGESVTHGARDCLIKPVRIEALKNLWQPVVQQKTGRFLWSVEQHRQFVVAVNQLGGFEKAVPKQILDLMNNPTWLTIERVALHLKKYRLYHQRLSQTQVQSPGIPSIATKGSVQYRIRTRTIIIILTSIIFFIVTLVHCLIMDFRERV